MHWGKDYYDLEKKGTPYHIKLQGNYGLIELLNWQKVIQGVPVVENPNYKPSKNIKIEVYRSKGDGNEESKRGIVWSIMTIHIISLQLVNMLF